MSADTTFCGLLGSIADRTPAPGGGAVTGYAGALGVALAHMVVSYSVGSKKLEAHQEALTAAADALEHGRARMLRLADEDARVYERMNTLMRLPDGDATRSRDLPDAARACIAVPMGVIEACADMLRLYDSLVPISNRMLRSDLAIGAILTESTARASLWNVRINLSLLEDEAEREALLSRAGATLEECTGLLRSVEAGCV